MNIQERIAGLPKRPHDDHCEQRKDFHFLCRCTERWTLARLALYNELALSGDVRLYRHTKACMDARNGCTCGRDALLAAMEVPK
jgi:hypothetical protein